MSIFFNLRIDIRDLFVSSFFYVVKKYPLMMQYIHLKESGIFLIHFCRPCVSQILKFLEGSEAFFEGSGGL
jgi:hypothetical protein